MFMVIWKHDYYSGRYIVLSDNHRTLKDAANARMVSGDLVVDKRNNTIPEDDSWLWDWEKADPKSYAHRHLGKAIDKRGKNP